MSLMSFFPPKPSSEDGFGWQELPVTHLAVAAMGSEMSGGEFTAANSATDLAEDFAVHASAYSKVQARLTPPSEERS